MLHSGAECVQEFTPVVLCSSYLRLPAVLVVEPFTLDGEAADRKKRGEVTTVFSSTSRHLPCEGEGRAVRHLHPSFCEAHAKRRQVQLSNGARTQEVQSTGQQQERHIRERGGHRRRC